MVLGNIFLISLNILCPKSNINLLFLDTNCIECIFPKKKNFKRVNRFQYAMVHLIVPYIFLHIGVNNLEQERVNFLRS